MPTSASSESVRVVDFSALPNDQRKRVVFLCRDPGGWNTLRPLIEALSPSRTHKPVAALSGYALDAVYKMLDESKDEHIRPLDDRFIDLKPDVFVTAGSWSNHHLEIAAREHFHKVKMVYVENNYQQYGQLFKNLVKRSLRLPDFACCIDSCSLDDLLGAYPAYDCKAFTTGQPTFVRFASEDPALRVNARKALSFDKPLAVFMGMTDNVPLVTALAKALATRGCTTPVYTVRKHPRDETLAASYAEIFDQNGLSYFETEAYDTETVALAADLVLSTWSTQLVHAALRLIPAAYVVDERYVTLEAGIRFPLPPARVGAAQHCRTVERAAEFVQAFLDRSHPAHDPEAVAHMMRRQTKFRQAHPKKAIENILTHIREIAC